MRKLILLFVIIMSVACDDKKDIVGSLGITIEEFASANPKWIQDDHYATFQFDHNEIIDGNLISVEEQVTYYEDRIISYWRGYEDRDINEFFIPLMNKYRGIIGEGTYEHGEDLTILNDSFDGYDTWSSIEWKGYKEVDGTIYIVSIVFNKNLDVKGKSLTSITTRIKL